MRITCNKCGKTKDITEMKKTKRKTPVKLCKACHAADCRERYRKADRSGVETKQKRAEAERRYYQANREKILARKRKYRQENQDKIKAYRKKYVQSLKKGYVIKTITKNSNLEAADIREQEELIAAKRQYLINHRIIKHYEAHQAHSRSSGKHD